MQNRYPFWKNALVVTLTLFGFLYALPNLYSEDPVVQVSTQTPVALQGKVQQLLLQAKIPYRTIRATNDGVEISFASTDVQLAASDWLKHELGANFTVALNLVSSTPAWLRAIGAEPMKQGLDLRGGVHFLLEVDVDSVINRRYEGLMKTMTQSLRTTGIRYSGVIYRPSQGILLKFRTIAALEAATADLTQKYSGVVLAHDANTLALNITITPSELNTIRQNTIEQTMSILRNRVNELGVGEAVVQQQGATRIAVDLPGIQDAARAKQILGGTATLQFHLVDATHDARTVMQAGTVPFDSKIYNMDGEPLLLKRQVVLSGDSITSAISSYDQQTAMPAVQIQLGGGGEALFTKITKDNIGKRMAIVFVETKTINQLIDGVEQRVTSRSERVISAPVIQSALGSNFQITGIADAKEASNLALLLRAGALPAAIYPVAERTIGPSLGHENIKRGMISLALGMGCILVIMLLYYRLFGLIANIALLLNLILLIALLSVIGATLTFPGIAGIVLTVGMAVDANVLIYERIREELRHGVTPQAAIFAGYERAFSTILDANVTTFIVAIVLFSVGAGPVRGFAVTLSLGLLTSMLTGVTFTRALVNIIYGRRNVKKLSIGYKGA